MKISKEQQKQLKQECPDLRGLKICGLNETQAEVAILDHLELKGWDPFEAEGFVYRKFKELGMGGDLTAGLLVTAV